MEFDTLEERIDWQFQMSDLLDMIRSDSAHVVWYRNHISNGTYDSVVGLNRFVMRLESNIVKMKNTYEDKWNELNLEQKHYYAFAPYNLWPWWL